MIETYPNYLDQTQVMDFVGILNYHGVPVSTPYPLSIAISKATEYSIAISKATEYKVTTSKSGG